MDSWRSNFDSPPRYRIIWGHMLHYWSRFVVCWMCRVPWAFGSLQHPMARQVGIPFVEYLCSLLGLIGMAPVWCLDETARFLYPPVLSFFSNGPWGFCWADFGTTIVHWQGWCGPTCWSLRDFLFIGNLFEDLPGARCRSWRSLGLQLLSNCVGNSQLSGSLGRV